MKQLSNFIVHPITIIYLLIGLIFNKFNFLILHYLIAFIHELSHYLMGKFLNIKVGEICFLPIGFYVKMPTLQDEKFIKQFLVLIAGPLSYFISFAVLKLLYNFNVISIYGYEDGIISNRFILLFNLLPIYPLDGEKIIELFLTPILNEYKLRVVRIIISILTIIIGSYFFISLGEILSILFLIFGIIISLINLKKDYFFYLIGRLNKKEKSKIKINTKNEIYRLKDNYLLIDGQILNEDQIIKNILKNHNLKDEIEM
jgi:stage IV sporulation protein FB